MAPGASTLGIDTLLTELGLGHPEAVKRARELLVEAGLTRPGKTGIDASKRERMVALLESLLFASCGRADCDRAAGIRQRLPVTAPEDCHFCHGSDNRRALRLMEAQLARTGLSRVLVVGGSPPTIEALRQQKGAAWELRWVEGTERCTAAQARTDLQWAELVLVWGSTPLDHRVSDHYTRPAHPHRVNVARRGVAALIDAATLHLERTRV